MRISDWSSDVCSSDLLDVEGEVTYRENDFDEIDLLGSSLDAGGDVSSLAFMGNIWVNLEFGDSGFAPYLGGGIGAMRIETNDVSVIGFDLSDESDTVGAGQLGAGIGYRIDRKSTRLNSSH